MTAPAYVACPKCGITVDASGLECPACGVVFAKVRRLDAAAADTHPSPVPFAPDVAHGAWPGQLHSPDESQGTVSGIEARALAAPLWWGRAVGLAVLVWLTWRFAPTPFGPEIMGSVLHLPNLVFHEAGHVLFSPFGRFLTVLGGSLFQVLVPIGLAVAMARERQTFGAIVAGWWAGQNLLDVAPYAADARALSLVLLGGKTGAEVEGHDWEYLLESLGWLHLDRTIGLALHWTGVLVMLGALAAAVWVLVRARPETRAATTPAPAVDAEGRRPRDGHRAA